MLCKCVAASYVVASYGNWLGFYQLTEVKDFRWPTSSASPKSLIWRCSEEQYSDMKEL